jgi:hypothetical protein
VWWSSRKNLSDPIMTAIDVAIVLACALVPPLVCTVVGAAVGRGATRLPGADMLVGAGLAGGALTILAITTRVPLSTLMLAISGLAVLVALVRRRLPGGVATWVALALLGPLLVGAAATQATLWDEFTQWLPDAVYDYTHDALARRGLPPPFSRWAAYPQAMPLAIAAASFLARRFLEGAGAVTNVALLAAYGALLAIVRSELMSKKTAVKALIGRAKATKLSKTSPKRSAFKASNWYVSAARSIGINAVTRQQSGEGPGRHG